MSSSSQCYCPNADPASSFFDPVLPLSSRSNDYSHSQKANIETAPLDEPGAERFVVLIIAATLYLGYLIRRYVLSVAKAAKKASRTQHIPSPLKARIIRNNSISADLHSDDQLERQLRQPQQQQPPSPSTLRHRNTPRHQQPQSQSRQSHLTIPPSPPQHRRVSTASTASDSAPPLPRTPPVRHFKYYNTSKGSRSVGGRRGHYSPQPHYLQSHLSDDQSDFDVNGNSDYLSDAINPDLMPMPSNNSPRSRQNREFTVSNPVVQSEDGIPVSTSNPTFTFPSRNSSATQPSTTYSPPITISPPPPNIHLDSQPPKPSVSNTTPDDSADQKSFKSGISKTSISTTQREFEQVVKLRDEDESESSETKGSNSHGTSASGVPFWRRSFSRPASIHELQDHAAIGTSASTSSAITAAGSSLLPKLSLFKRRSNSDLVGAVAMGAISTSGNTNSSSNSSNAAPNSPIAMPSPVSTVMKGFWPMKSSASSAANRGADTDPLVKREDSDTSNRVTDLLASVPTLGLPKVSKKSDKKKASAAANAGASTTTATAIEKTEKVKEPSRFWPSTANANQAPKSPTQSKKGKAAATKQPQIKASDTRRASVDSNHVDGGTGSIASSNTSGSKLFWSKPKTPSISYAKAVAKTDESNGGQSASSGVKVPVVSVNVEDDSQNWLDVDDHHSRSSDQSTSWDRNVLSRFKWQTKSKSGNFLKSFNNGADSRSISPSTGGTTSKLFGLRKRASNETMKSEFLRMAATPPAPVEELIDDGYSQEYATTNSSSSFFPSLRISTPQFLISDFDNIPLQRDPSNRYNNQFEQPPQQYQSFQQPQQQSHQQQQNDFNSPITPNRLYESDDNLSWNDFQSRRNPKNVEPIHRPNSGKTRSIASAPGSNLKRNSSVVSLNESTLTREVSPSSATVPGGGFGGGSSGTTGESTLYSPFFSGLEIPMTQRPTGSISSATSSFHLDTSSSLNGSSSKSHRSKHHHYHHHHHFYHFPAAGGAITVEGGNGNSGGPVNLPLVNVQQQSEELGVSFRRLRKLSHDAGLYGQNQQAIHDQYVPGDGFRDTVRAHDGLSSASGASSIAYGASKLGTRSSGSTMGSYVTVADENVETGGLPTVGE